MSDDDDAPRTAYTAAGHVAHLMRGSFLTACGRKWIISVPMTEGDPVTCRLCKATILYRDTVHPKHAKE